MSLRIVHVVSSLNVGGMEHFVVRLAARQQTEGHRVSVVAMQGGPLREEAARLKLVAYELGGRSKVWRVLKAIGVFRWLRPDVVHGHNATSLQYALLARRCTRAKIVITCHGRGKADYKEPGPELWGQVDRVVCVSDAVARATEDVPADRICVVRNGVDASMSARSREEVRRELRLGDAFTAIIVARIDHLKGHDTLLRAWADVHRTDPEATLLIVGDGAERAAMERLAAEAGVAAAVRFLGFRSDVIELLGAADLFLLPSLTEGLPLSILEAMAHGLPIVATHVGGIPELVTEEREGLLVPPKDVAALAAAIGRMAFDAEARGRFARQARERAINEFSFDAMLRQYEDVYCALMG